MELAFAMYDKNGDGQITLNEYKEVMASLGEDVKTSEKLFNMMEKMADKDGDRKINYKEFIKFMDDDSSDEEEDAKDELTAAFAVINIDGDKFITKEELKTFAETYEIETEPGQIDEMIENADTDGDGKVNFEEFAKLFEEMNK